MTNANRWTRETTFWMLVCAIVALPHLLFSCGTQVKAVQGGVHVDTSNCRENAASAGNLDRTILDCVSGGDVMIRIELARSAWDAIHLADAGILDSSVDGGGGPLEATRILAIDGSHCTDDPRDKGDGENARIYCRSLGGLTDYLVTIGRQEWRAIKARTRPAPFEAGPGK